MLSLSVPIKRWKKRPKKLCIPVIVVVLQPGEAAFTLPEQPETRLSNMQYSSMGRVSEAVSVKRGVMLQVLKLAERNRNAGNAETRQHYEDLVVRIKEALNIR